MYINVLPGKNILTYPLLECRPLCLAPKMMKAALFKLWLVCGPHVITLLLFIACYNN